MDTCSQQARLDLHEEQLQRLQSDVAELKSDMAELKLALEADRSEEREFRKFVLNWMKEQYNLDIQVTGGVSLTTGSLHPKSTLGKEEETSQVSNDITPPSPPPLSPSPWFKNSTKLSLAIPEGVNSDGEILEAEKSTKVPTIDNAHHPFDKMLQQLLTPIGKYFCQVFFVIIDKGIYINNCGQTFKVFVRKKDSWFEVLLVEMLISTSRGVKVTCPGNDSIAYINGIERDADYIGSCSEENSTGDKKFGPGKLNDEWVEEETENPSVNVINGGSHAGNKLVVQEFMILPMGASSFKEAMKMDVELYHNLKSVIKKKYGQDPTNGADEGGFASNIQENKEGLELLKTTIGQAGYTGKVVIGMDVAASEFYGKDKTYDLNSKEENNNESLQVSGVQLKDICKSFVSEYPIVSIEDPFDQDDWETYAKMTTECGDIVQLVGDDLLVTNPTRFMKAIIEKTCNALLLKVNQIGSVAESIEAVKMSKQAGWGVMASQYSGETEDTFIRGGYVDTTRVLMSKIKTGNKMHPKCDSDHFDPFSLPSLPTEVKYVQMHHKTLLKALSGGKVGFKVKSVAVEYLKCGYVASNSKEDPAKGAANFSSHLIIIYRPGQIEYVYAFGWDFHMSQCSLVSSWCEFTGKSLLENCSGQRSPSVPHYVSGGEQDQEVREDWQVYNDVLNQVSPSEWVWSASDRRIPITILAILLIIVHWEQVNRWWLIQWKRLMAEETTGNEAGTIKSQILELSLEDKTCFEGESNDRNPDIGIKSANETKLLHVYFIRTKRVNQKIV